MPLVAILVKGALLYRAFNLLEAQNRPDAEFYFLPTLNIKLGLNTNNNGIRRRATVL